MFCSDGLNSMVPMEDLTQMFKQPSDDLDELAGALIDAANQRGGDDNITIVLVQKD